MKRIVSFALAGLLLLTLTSCASPNSPVELQSTPIISETMSIPPNDSEEEEYQRAVSYGFLPEDVTSTDPQTVVTWKQYCNILGKIIETYDASLLPEWQRMTNTAPQTEIKRDGAMVALLFAAKTMKMTAFNGPYPNDFYNYEDKMRDVVTMDYPVFDWNTPIDLGYDHADSNHVGPAYDFCLLRVSWKSQMSLLTFDENGDLRLEQPLTLRDAALSALRLYESQAVSTVSEQTLEQAVAMPKAEYNDLPRWYGYSVPARSWWYGFPTEKTYTEDEINIYASFGFNFLRVPMLFEELFPNGDVTQPDRAAFVKLDELLTYAAKNGIHVSIDLHSMPGFSTDANDDNDILFEDEAKQELFSEIWRNIAHYFRNVPSNLLSFNLLNEPHAKTDEELTDEVYSAVMQRAINSIREESPDRLIIASGVGVSWAEPCEGLADSMIVQGTSAYFLNDGTDMWPLYYINKNMNGNEGDLTLNGNFPEGSIVTLSLMQYCATNFEFFADNVCIANFSIAGDNFSGTGLSIEYGANQKDWVGDGNTYGWYTIEVPINEACKSLRLSERDGGNYQIYSIIVKTPEANYAIMANDCYVSSQTPPELTLLSDETVEAKDKDTMVAMNEEGLVSMMSKYARFTERTGQECILLEFGFNRTIPYDVAMRAADAFFNAADRTGLSWCTWSDDFGPIINYKVATDYAENDNNDYRRTDAEYKALDKQFSYLPELMEIYQNHMK